MHLNKQIELEFQYRRVKNYNSLLIFCKILHESKKENKTNKK
jgi:hypothetical protein